MQPLTIKLSPHDAITLATFHAEFKDDISDVPECESLRDAIKNFLDQVCAIMPREGLEDAHAEIEVNILLGKSPERPARQ